MKLPKLINSQTEEAFRSQLIQSNEGLQSHDSTLGEILRHHDYQTQRAYILKWTPDQDWDEYLVLIDGAFILHIEIDQATSPPSVKHEKIELEVYLDGLSKINQIRLAVAMDLANSFNGK